MLPVKHLSLNDHELLQDIFLHGFSPYFILSYFTPLRYTIGEIQCLEPACMCVTPDSPRLGDVPDNRQQLRVHHVRAAVMQFHAMPCCCHEVTCVQLL